MTGIVGMSPLGLALSILLALAYLGAAVFLAVAFGRTAAQRDDPDVREPRP